MSVLCSYLNHLDYIIRYVLFMQADIWSTTPNTTRCCLNVNIQRQKKIFSFIISFKTRKHLVLVWTIPNNNTYFLEINVARKSVLFRLFLFSILNFLSGIVQHISSNFTYDVVVVVLVSPLPSNIVERRNLPKKGSLDLVVCQTRAGDFLV